MRALLFVLIMPVGTGVARAQSPDMVTDRPDQTESAAVVPRGLLQVETGWGKHMRRRIRHHRIMTSRLGDCGRPVEL